MCNNEENHTDTVIEEGHVMEALLVKGNRLLSKAHCIILKLFQVSHFYIVCAPNIHIKWHFNNIRYPKRRLGLFGHVARLQSDVPANQIL